MIFSNAWNLFIKIDSRMEVHASVLDSKQIYYKCPVCNGSHSHGSDGNFDNRIEHRLSHCNGEQVRIVIKTTPPDAYNNMAKSSCIANTTGISQPNIVTTSLHYHCFLQPHHFFSRSSESMDTDIFNPDVDPSRAPLEACQTSSGSKTTGSGRAP